MIVAGRVGREVAQGVDGDAVVGGGVSDSTGVPSDGSCEDVVGGLGPNEGTGTAQNGIGSEGRPL